MADKKISALTSATTPLDGTEVLPLVQSGATVKVANNDLRPKQIQSNATSGVLQVAGPAAASTRVMTTPDANFTAARTDAAQSFTGDQTLSTGNLVQGTAAKGINFTANTAAAGMTSQLLNWYEEGTWTPSVGGNATYTSRSGSYTRTGNRVTCTGSVVINVLGTGSAIQLSGLPYATAEFSSVLVGYFTNLATSVYWVSGYSAGNTSILFTCTTASATTATESFNIFGNGTRVDFSITYRI
jgi:hypothetical protein